jgi:anti-sigma-K factor RskA
MSCRFAHDDGAYVLGALSPADRQAFERHLPGCADCTRAVGELAGLPGLLGSVEASVIEQEEVDDPVPATLLPALYREVRQARRRRTWAAAGLAAAAAAVAVVAVVALTAGQDGRDEASAPTDPEASSSPADPSPSAVTPQRMQPVGDVPVRATVTLEQVTWGTRLELACTYDSQWVEYDLPAEADYTLHVRTRDGRAERVGSWRSVDGLPMTIAAATAASAEELASVEVRTADGRVVLRLAT